MLSLKRVLGFTSIVLFGVALFVFFANYTIKQESRSYISRNIQDLPNKKVGLLLGTSKTTKRGYPNWYFNNRIDAAEKLFKSGKIEYIIVSGDNSRKNYNEPEDMKNELIARGIPSDKIYEDFAGFRTLDSIIRAKEIFGQNSFIIISQTFHNERAVYIARQKELDAYGYNAKGVRAQSDIKTRIREYFAKTKVFIDLWFGEEPKFLGEKVIIS
ncbi:hypothetical protein BPO_1886 [Bergeyella porcorum]|uniref:DUF218 domain-containing protein n=1 Tax=Bergeyella porcorum TaxID=1735111 RepID=A0AAU0F2V8_9FLAO